jgi:hypothetical protein
MIVTSPGHYHYKLCTTGSYFWEIQAGVLNAERKLVVVRHQVGGLERAIFDREQKVWT